MANNLIVVKHDDNYWFHYRCMLAALTTPEVTSAFVGIMESMPEPIIEKVIVFENVNDIKYSER